MLAAAWIPTPQEEPPAPKFAYLASSWRSCAPSWHQDATTSPKISKKTPSWSQHLPTELPKPSQDSLQDPPEEAPTPKTPPKVMECWSFLHFSHFSNDREKSNQKCSQDPPKAAKLSPRWPSWRHHGPSWAQLAANLAHLASILGPSSPQLRQKSPPDRARNLKKRPQRPQDHPGGRQRAPGQPLGPEFSWFGDRFRT